MLAERKLFFCIVSEMVVLAIRLDGCPSKAVEVVRGGGQSDVG